MERYIIKSQQVFTGLMDKPQPAMILVNGSEIEAVLPEEADLDRYGNIPVKDYGDSLIIPSFLDAHTHMFSGAIDASDYVCDTLGECKSQEECVERIKAYAKEHPNQRRIRGVGWFVGAWNDAPLPDKRSLDAAIPDRPVYLLCADSHSMWLNTKAMEEVGFSSDFDVENGEVCRFADGSLTGLFIEPAAYAPAMEKYMEFSATEMLDIHRGFQKKLASYGVSAVSEMFADDYTEDTKRRYEQLVRLDEEEGLCAQTFIYTKLFDYTDFTPFFKMRDEVRSEHVHIAGVKGFIDGVTETYTGLLLEPYTDKPETCGEGLPLHPKELMQQEIIAANRAGIQVRLHCIGDGAVRMALDMYEEAEKQTGVKDLCNTIEHIENIHPDDIDRFAELDVIPSMQPYHVTLSNGGKVWRLGEERCKLEFPIRTISDRGGKIAIGTDYPVVTINPFYTIYAAVTRCDDEGKPTGCNSATEKLPLAQVLKAYTAGAAQVYHASDRMGTLEPGKMANILVLTKNLFEIPVEQIRDTRVSVNYFEGREVYHE